MPCHSKISSYLVIHVALELNLRLENVFSLEELMFDVLMAQAQYFTSIATNNHFPLHQLIQWNLLNYYNQHASKNNVLNAQSNDVTHYLSVDPKRLYDQYACFAGTVYEQDAQTTMAKLLLSFPCPELFHLDQAAYDKKLLECALQGSDKQLATNLLNNAINNTQQPIPGNTSAQTVIALVEKIQELNKQLAQQPLSVKLANQSRFNATFFQPATTLETIDIKTVQENKIQDDEHDLATALAAN